MSLSRLVFSAGCWIGLCRFLITVFLFTFLNSRSRRDENLKERLIDYFKVHRAFLIAWFYAKRGHNKDAMFLWLYKLTPIWFENNFLADIFDFWKWKMWNVAVNDMILLSENVKDLTVCVSFDRVIERAYETSKWQKDQCTHLNDRRISFASVLQLHKHNDYQCPRRSKYHMSFYKRDCHAARQLLGIHMVD